ncbi:hypothetical protein [Pedobacter boryungensis]|uniref:Lipopolysaccharide biosynthesis protein n=1 Tax=Pedobacter boryungensis TaxID=869962 RepID=A0ABX2DFE5_9SPHI|nr:hypothetical protein [Pedobacter boryungensis]NQX32757.1 hypothetical protein [Pedobacter boryungensis]
MRNDFLKDKRVLFIGMGFYDYDHAIIEQFKKFGAKVDYFSEVPTGYQFRYALRTDNQKAKQQIVNNLSFEIAQSSQSDYDIVFVIKGEYLTIEAIEILKSKSKSAKWIFYLWDSIARIPSSARIMGQFDEVYSFDRIECIDNPNMKFNPLFYREEYAYRKPLKEASIDLYFLGWYHSDRLKLVKKISNFCDQHRLKYNMKLYSGRFSYLLHTLMGGELKGNRQLLTFKPTTAKKNMEGILSSRCSLDIAHPLQCGLTMRTIELLGAQKKIITTNRDIVNYDFYHPNNVLLIDRENPELNVDFFKSDYTPISIEIVSQYTIESWLKRMIINK